MKKILVIIFILCFVSAVFADDFHYENIIVGDRASGMGGAYIAVSDDAAGMYYNPAGIAYSVGRNLSASVNAYHNLEKKFDGVIGNYGWKRSSSALIPNFFGIIQPVGNFKLGLSYAVPDSIKEDQDQVFLNVNANVNRYVINLNNDDNTYNIGVTIAKDITKKFATGLTLYLHRRETQMIFNQFIERTTPPAYEWTNNYLEVTETGIKPVLGFMFSPVDKVSLGLKLSKIFIIDSNSVYQETLARNGYSSAPTNLPDVTPTAKFSTTDSKRKYPYNIGFGVAYFPSNSLIVSADVNYYTKVDDDIFGDKKATLNLALGTEYYFSKTWAVRGGLFTNRSNSPNLPNGGRTAFSPIPEDTDIYGASLSISRFTRNTSITLGGNFSYGTGEAQVVSGSSSLQDETIKSWTIFISSSYSY
ncbi:MAG: hypothetical protein N2999_01160 [Proteobacteria bacterium]|nr:hypothetical protein [Pseudomonadota bacterium]